MMFWSLFFSTMNSLVGQENEQTNEKCLLSSNLSMRSLSTNQNQNQSMYRQTNFQTTSNIITFDIVHEEAHKDITFELTIGQHPMSVRIFLVERGDGYYHNTNSLLRPSSSASSSSSSSLNINNNSNTIDKNSSIDHVDPSSSRSEAVTKALSQFAAMNRGFSITAKHLLTSSASSSANVAAINTSGIIFYANDSPEQRICDYRHQVRVRSKSDTTATRGPGEIYSGDPLVQLSAISGKLYMAMSCVEDISMVALVCYLDPPRTTVTDKDDDFHSIWRVSSNYVVSPSNQAAVVQKLRVKQHLMDDYNALRDPVTGMTPLHVIGAHAGDPAFAKLLLTTGWKAFDPDLLDEVANNGSDDGGGGGKGDTPIIKLLQRPAVHDPDGPWHNRTVALLDIFVKFAGASLGIQSKSTGDTATHLAVRHHAYGGKILPFILSVGGGHATILSMRNNKGLTPEEELTGPSQQQNDDMIDQNKRTGSLQNFVKSGKDEAVKLLHKCDKEMLQERAQNRLKVRGLPLYQGKSYGNADDGGGMMSYFSSGSKRSPSSRVTTTPNSKRGNTDDQQQQQENHKTTTMMMIGGGIYNNNSEYQPESLKQPAPDLVVWDNELTKADRRFDADDTNPSSDGIRRPVVRAKLVKLIFSKYDTDEDGFISRNALLHAIHSYDSIGLPQEAVDSVIESIGICTDGRVNLDEFALILLKLQNRG